MARKRPKPRLVDRYLPDVQAAVNVKYGPEMNALRDLLSSAQSQRDQAIAGAEAGRQGILNAMRGIAPMVQTAYRSAGLDPSAAINALGSYGSQAAQAAIVQRRQALDQYHGDVAKIQDRQTQLQSEAGDFAVSELNRLLEGARGRAVTRRGQDISAAQRAADRSLRRGDQRLRAQSEAETHRHNVAMENKPRGGGSGGSPRGGGSGGSRLRFGTPTQQTAAVAKVNQAQGWIRRLGKAIPSPTLRQWLLTGYTIPAEKDSKGHVTSPAVKLPALPKWAINAAYDLEVKHGLSRPNVRALHQAGVKVHGRFPILGRSAPKQHTLPKYPH